MAKMKEGIHFTGTIGIICYYQSYGRTYARRKSSLTRERVLYSKDPKDAGFEKTRKYAGDMGRASRIASFVYRALPADIKGRWIFRAITGETASLLYKGKEEQEIKEILWEKYIKDPGCENKEATGKSSRSSRKANRQLKTIFLEHWEKQDKPKRYFTRAWIPGSSFNPETIRRRSEYFLGLKHALRLE